MHKAANTRQVGGSHYKNGVEHWDMVVNAGNRYLEGQCTKYLTRWRDKGQPKLDLEKSLHYLEKLIEEANAKTVTPPGNELLSQDLFEKFYRDNNLDPTQGLIIYWILTWGSADILGAIHPMLKKYVAKSMEELSRTNLMRKTDMPVKIIEEQSAFMTKRDIAFDNPHHGHKPVEQCEFHQDHRLCNRSLCFRKQRCELNAAFDNPHYGHKPEGDDADEGGPRTGYVNQD